MQRIVEGQDLSQRVQLQSDKAGMELFKEGDEPRSEGDIGQRQRWGPVGSFVQREAAEE